MAEQRKRLIYAEFATLSNLLQRLLIIRNEQFSGSSPLVGSLLFRIDKPAIPHEAEPPETIRRPLTLTETIGEYLAHRVGGAPRRRIVVVSIPLHGETGSRVAGEGLEVPYGLAALGK